MVPYVDVNTARRAEQKVKRILQERRDCQNQWQAFELDLKKCFATEKARFQAALAKLEKEEADAIFEQTSARTHLRRIASGQEQEPLPQQGKDFMHTLQVDTKRYRVTLKTVYDGAYGAIV